MAVHFCKLTEKTRMGRKAVVKSSIKFGLGLVVVLIFVSCAARLHADTLTVGGVINQSIQDGTGPAVNNPSLNNILDGAFYTVNLGFAESITSPGTYDLTGLNLRFEVVTDSAIENSFDSVSLTVAQSGSFDQISILACLTTGSGCNQGNELDLDFMIPSANLNSENVVAQGIPNLLPLDLLEDDGITDIHASVTSYSYTPSAAAVVPEPSASVMLLSGLTLVALKYGKY